MNHNHPIYYKLVRSKIIKIRYKDGWNVQAIELEPKSETARIFVNLKVAEEVGEFRSASSRKSEIEEASDVEVVLFWAAHHKIEIVSELKRDSEDLVKRYRQISGDEMDLVRAAKRKQAGEFETLDLIISESRDKPAN